MLMQRKKYQRAKDIVRMGNICAKNNLNLIVFIKYFMKKYANVVIK